MRERIGESSSLRPSPAQNEPMGVRVRRNLHLSVSTANDPDPYTYRLETPTMAQLSSLFSDLLIKRPP